MVCTRAEREPPRHATPVRACPPAHALRVRRQRRLPALGAPPDTHLPILEKVSSDEPPVPFSNRLVVMARQFDVPQAVYAKALAAFKVSGSYGMSPNLVYSGVKKSGESFPKMGIF